LPWYPNFDRSISLRGFGDWGCTRSAKRNKTNRKRQFRATVPPSITIRIRFYSRHRSNLIEALSVARSPANLIGSHSGRVFLRRGALPDGQKIKSRVLEGMSPTRELHHGRFKSSKNAARRRRFCLNWLKCYNVDSISNPQASRRASGMYLEFLLRRAHSRRRVDRMYWSGGSLNSLVICSKDVTVGTTGPMGSGLPQFGFPRRFAIDLSVLILQKGVFSCFNLGRGWGCNRTRGTYISILGLFCSKINRRG